MPVLYGENQKIAPDQLHIRDFLRRERTRADRQRLVRHKERTARLRDAAMLSVCFVKQHSALDVLAALPGVTYTGVSGDIAFDEIGDAVRDSAYIKTANTETAAWDFVTVQGVE